MEKIDFFRKEVIENLHSKRQNNVFMNETLPYNTLTILIIAITISIVLFVILAEFTEKYNITGYLNTDKGIISIYPTHAGIINKIFIKQGQKIQAGDKLFSINTIYTDINEELKKREFQRLQAREKTISQEVTNKKQQLSSLHNLMLNRHISVNTYQSKLDEISTLKSTKHQIQMDIIKYKKSLTYNIYAPLDGKITNIMYTPGQHINTTKPLTNILPKDSNLIAELYIPASKAILIHPDDEIILRYDAYPYQRFGVATAKVLNISQTILTDEDEKKPIKVGVPYYKLSAAISSQYIKLHNKQFPLQQGMTCVATIYGIKKKIWQWIFDPINNFYNKFSK